MSEFPSPESFTAEQIAALEQAERLIIDARKEAVALMQRAGIALPEEPRGHCTVRMEGGNPCPCDHYEGDGGLCTNKISVDPPTLPPGTVAIIRKQNIRLGFDC